jgi:uncharacterized membrane protein YphA (DoxX/SURF4 family)
MSNYRTLPKLEDFEAYRPSAAAMRKSMRQVDVSADTLTVRQNVVSWICQLVAAGIMLETLFFKFTAAPESVYIFQKMGTEPWWRWGQGIWELLASICLLIPRLRWAGGILTTGAMMAAILSHMTWLGYSIMGDHGLLFGMALITFTCGVTVMMLHRHSIPWITPLSSW